MSKMFFKRRIKFFMFFFSRCNKCENDVVYIKHIKISLSSKNKQNSSKIKFNSSSIHLSINIRNHNKDDFLWLYNARNNFKIFLSCLYSFDMWQYIFSSLRHLKRHLQRLIIWFWDKNQQRISSSCEIFLMRTLQRTHSEHYLFSANRHESQCELYTWRKSRRNQIYK